MEISSPLCITSRLLPGCRIGGASISIEYCCPPAGRQYYRWYIDLDSQEFSDDGLASGAGGGTLQEGLKSLLCFLGAFAEEWRYQFADGSDDCIRNNCNLFPRELADWAIENADEFTKMELELQEHPNELIVE